MVPGDAPRLFPLFLNAAFLLLCFLFLAAKFPNAPPLRRPPPIISANNSIASGHCAWLDQIEDPKSKCAYLQSTAHACVAEGLIDYLYLFYCSCDGSPLLGYALLSLWLLVLFYLLSNTASEFLCPALEGLARELRLSPSIAGATLLALGNGAPDVFATVVSFASGSSGDVGVGSVLGGGFFVSTAVVGAIGLFIPTDVEMTIESRSFARDVGFLMAAQVALAALLVSGRVSVLTALSFLSLYVVYLFFISTESCRNGGEGPNSAMLVSVLIGEERTEKPGDAGAEEGGEGTSCCRWCCKIMCSALAMPLYLPRRMTIPVVSEEGWSRPFAAASAAMGPMLVAVLWDCRWGGEEGFKDQRLEVYLSASLVGIVLGLLALELTGNDKAPEKFLLPWLAGGFGMSVIWSYITATELVALLGSLARVAGIAPSSLAVTVLAWGNSAGDLAANFSMAARGGEGGVRTAISACYAGPFFNTVLGLGLSLLYSAWAARPAPTAVPAGGLSFEMIGFLVCGLLWAVVVAGKRGMRVDRTLGLGLTAIYVCFLCVRISEMVPVYVNRIPR